jgi:hypothetical protein
MAVKVISAKPAKSVVKRITCKNCGARLEYAPNDVKECHGHDLGGGPDGQEWVSCPNCKKRAIIRSW